MQRLVSGTMTVAIAAVVMFAMLGANLSAQQALPNDYRINRDWMKLDRPFGTMTGALMDPDGEHHLDDLEVWREPVRWQRRESHHQDGYGRQCGA